MKLMNQKRNNKLIFRSNRGNKPDSLVKMLKIIQIFEYQIKYMLEQKRKGHKSLMIFT